MWTSKKALRKKIADLEAQLMDAEGMNDELNERIHYINETLEFYQDTFPFELGEVVYDVQLRGANGRYTKTKASKEHSVINEVEVDEKNYFKLVERYRNHDVFLARETALAHLDTVCIE